MLGLDPEPHGAMVKLLSHAHISLASETPNTLVWPNQPPRVVPFYLSLSELLISWDQTGPSPEQS